MNASELRIGNWVNNEGDILKITNGWQIDDAIHQYEPIPLTEEWLLTFGFAKDTGFHKHLYAVSPEGYWGLYIDLENREFIIEGGEWSHGAPCGFVHQLQNLYFALTGEELTIKES